jgi:hypothetical protein
MMISRLISFCFSFCIGTRLFFAKKISSLRVFASFILVIFCLSTNGIFWGEISYTFADGVDDNNDLVIELPPKSSPSVPSSATPKSSPSVPSSTTPKSSPSVPSSATPKSSPSVPSSATPKSSPSVPSQTNFQNTNESLFSYIESLVKVLLLSLVVHFVYLGLVKLSLRTGSQDMLGGIVAKFFNIWLNTVARQAKNWQYGLMVLIHSLPASVITVSIWQNLSSPVVIINAVIMLATFIVWIAKR